MEINEWKICLLLSSFSNPNASMKVQIEESWQQRLQDEFDKPYFEKLVAFVKSEYKKAHVLPPGHQIFHVFNACPFEKVKIVILGQDPYPNPGQYYGVCFSVPDGVAIPGSLANIYIVKTIWYIIHWNIIYKVLLLLRWVTNKKQILPNIKCLLIVVFCCFHIAFSFFSDAWLLFSLFCFHAFVTSCNYWLLTKRKILSHQDLLSWCLILRCFAFADIAIP